METLEKKQRPNEPQAKEQKSNGAQLTLAALPNDMFNKLHSFQTPRDALRTGVTCQSLRRYPPLPTSDFWLRRAALLFSSARSLFELLEPRPSPKEFFKQQVSARTNVTNFNPLADYAFTITFGNTGSSRHPEEIKLPPSWSGLAQPHNQVDVPILPIDASAPLFQIDLPTGMVYCDTITEDQAIQYQIIDLHVTERRTGEVFKLATACEYELANVVDEDDGKTRVYELFGDDDTNFFEERHNLLARPLARESEDLIVFSFKLWFARDRSDSMGPARLTRLALYAKVLEHEAGGRERPIETDEFLQNVAWYMFQRPPKDRKSNINAINL